MKLWQTEIKALPPGTEEIRTFIGPLIPADTFAEAQDYCNENGLGYCHIVGEFIEEIEDNPLRNKVNKFFWDTILN